MSGQGVGASVLRKEDDRFLRGRGQYVAITQAGRQLQKKMWETYSAAIERHIGSKLSDSAAVKLSELLDQLERELREPVSEAVRRAVLELHVRALLIAELPQALNDDRGIERL
jgi:DNA-binding MarR family transcriptional regulator